MTTVALGLRIVAAVRGGAVKVARPHGVVHLYLGPLTRTGLSVPSAGRPLCGIKSRRLRPVAQDSTSVPGGSRFCRRCTSVLPISLGTDVQRLVSRDDDARAYGHLTEADLVQAARWTNTQQPAKFAEALADNHQVGRVACVVLGGIGNAREVDQVLMPIRDRLRNALRTPDEIEAARREREAWDHNAELVRAARAKDDRIARAVQRQARGGYLMPHERELLNSA